MPVSSARSAEASLLACSSTRSGPNSRLMRTASAYPARSATPCDASAYWARPGRKLAPGRLSNGFSNSLRSGRTYNAPLPVGPSSHFCPDVA